jgi:hypothetical protein
MKQQPSDLQHDPHVERIYLGIERGEDRRA